MSAGRRPTMADVAARAGVSVSTVSLTYSGAGPISPDMKVRVERAAEELGYSGPSPQARALRSGRTHIVGLVVHDRLQLALRDPFTLGVLDALIGDLGEMGLGVLWLPSPPPAPTEPTLLDTAPMDAAVVMRVRDHDEPALDILAKRGVPVAIVEGMAPGAASVTIDDTTATRELIEHLVALGHTRIGTITLPRDSDQDTAVVTDDMLSGTLWTPTRNRLQAFPAAGIEPCVVVAARTSALHEGIAAGHLALAHESRPTALVCQSDLLAAGAVLAARERGLRVPEDVSITGFDGIDLAWLEPEQLTTVLQDAPAKGHLIAQAVRDVLAGETAPVLTLPLTMRVGTTTGPAA